MPYPTFALDWLGLGPQHLYQGKLIEKYCLLNELWFSLNNVNVTNGGTGVSHPVSDAPLNPETLSWMTAFPPLLAILGSVLSSVLLDKLGRLY